MGEGLDGADLFELLMHPETTTGEVTEMDFGMLAQMVRDRRKSIGTDAPISGTLTDEQVAQTIFDYARSVSPDTNVNPPTKAPSPATARNEFLGRLFLILMPIFLGIWMKAQPCPTARCTSEAGKDGSFWQFMVWPWQTLWFIGSRTAEGLRAWQPGAGGG